VPSDADAHSGFELNNAEIETALQTGEHAGLLEDYFGPEAYLELTRLAREAASRRVRGGPAVWIVPGLMGTKLGRRRTIRLFDDVVWFDPIDVALGKLDDLILPAGKKLRTLGVMLIAYLKLKLRRGRAGYDAEFYEYDWRLSIDKSGDQLKADLSARDGESVSLVAHSMGGMVARWALQHGAKCRRLIMLGTPNFGSFAPVQALRATYPVVRKVGALDQRRTAEELARDVFSSFDGLTQLLPFRERFSDLDLFDLDVWPKEGPIAGLRPRPEVLKHADRIQEELNAGRKKLGDNVFIIAGVERTTTIGAKVEQGEFVYERSPAGDGTVPLHFAELPEAAKHYYVEEDHGSLPNNAVVTRAVLDLLDRGTTDVLPSTYTGTRRAPASSVRDAELRVDPYPNRRGGTLSQRELRHLLEEVASPDARAEPAPAMAPGGAPLPTAASAATEGPLVAAGYRHPFDRVVVGRRRQHRVDIRFALGDITSADSRAVALGIFSDVAPTGAARAIDQRLGGAITEISRRRMFSAGVGEVFILPTGRHPIGADVITFIGLGAFDRFNEEVLQTAAENVLRTFVNTRVEEFATVLFGAGSGERPSTALQHLMTGFFRGLRDADHDHHFRRIVVCERDAERYVQLKEELYRLSSTALCHDVEITFDEVTLPPPLEAPPVARRRTAGRDDPVYLIVRRESPVRNGAQDSSFDVRSAVLTAGAKATVVTGLKSVAADKFRALRDRIVKSEKLDFGELGTDLSDLLLSDEVRTVMSSQRKPVPGTEEATSPHLIIVHDAQMSQVPWETMAFASREGANAAVWYPAAEQGISRRYAAENLSVAKWLEDRVLDGVLNVLLVVNPTEDLPGADREGKRVAQMFQALRGCTLDQLTHGDATRPALLSAFRSGKYDVVHYAGHAFFDERTPERSGILCHNEVPLSGADLSGLSNLPTLMFFNACESGRVRGERGRKQKDKQTHLRDSVGLAEAFMRGGIANFLGTYWPVEDAAADIFAEAFYTQILDGVRIGAAIQTARRAVRENNSRDWADYIFYGSHDFVLKEVQREVEGGIEP
jgi:hypothetical protein